MNSLFSVRVETGADRLAGAVKYASKQALRRAGAYVRAVAVNSVRKAKDAAPPGSPPHTRRGLLKRAVRFDSSGDGMTVAVGPVRSAVGLSMTAHEFGGLYRGRKYPQRRLMGPALGRSVPELAKLWRDSVK